MAKESRNDSKNTRQDKPGNQSSVNRDNQNSSQTAQTQKKQPGNA